MSKKQNLHTKFLPKNEPQNPEFQTSWNLLISALEPEPSSLFWLHTSVDVASDMPAS
jgi:hypothetical protein